MYLPHWPIPATIGNQNIDYETVFERMALVLDKLGNPHDKINNIIHIAGTNGKGSSSALLGEIYKRHGLNCNIYTSPHLHDCNERIVLNNEKISDSYLYEILEEVRIAASEVPLTFMESFSIAAFLAFSKNNADVNIIECGMGGRIDATNILNNKIATLITPISFDHQEYLGDSIERIALEKSMIIRPQTPLIVSAQSQKAKNIIQTIANDQKINHYHFFDDFDILRDDEDGSFDFNFNLNQSNYQITNIPKPNLLGDHQYINFASVIAVVKVLNYKFSVSDKTIKSAIQNIYWPGRLEDVTNLLKKHVKNCKIFIDGAHNSSGAFALAKWISQNKVDGKNYLIVGFSKDKCRKEFLMNFQEIDEIIAIKVDGEPYPESPEIIAKVATNINLKITQKPDLLEALTYINNQNIKNSQITICGSLHLNRDIKKFSKS